MKPFLKWPTTLFGLALVLVLAVALTFTFLRLNESSLTMQATSPLPSAIAPSPEATAPATEPLPTAIDVATNTNESLIGPPTTTPAPIPTSTATPVATPIPLAQPPFVPSLPDTDEPYKLLLSDGQVLRTFDRESLTERTIIDIPARTSLLLAERQNWVMPYEWGSVSPAGNKVALVLVNRSTTKGEPSLFSVHLLDIETGELDMLVENGLLPAWSPDGSRIAYRHASVKEVSQESSEGAQPITGTQYIRLEELRVVDVATKATSTLFTMEPGSEHTIGEIQWSPSGDRIAFVRTWNIWIGNGEIWTISTDGQGEAIQLTPMELYTNTISWSPDGKQIVFGNGGNLFIVSTDTGEHKQLTHHMTISGGSPVWLTETPWVAFTGLINFEGEAPPYDLWSINVQDSTLRRLTQTAETAVYPTWISNSNILLFQEQESGIWELNLHSGKRLQVYPQYLEYLVVR